MKPESFHPSVPTAPPALDPRRRPQWPERASGRCKPDVASTRTKPPRGFPTAQNKIPNPGSNVQSDLGHHLQPRATPLPAPRLSSGHTDVCAPTRHGHSQRGAFAAAASSARNGHRCPLRHADRGRRRSGLGLDGPCSPHPGRPPGRGHVALHSTAARICAPGAGAGGRRSEVPDPAPARPSAGTHAGTERADVREPRSERAHGPLALLPGTASVGKADGRPLSRAALPTRRSTGPRALAAAHPPSTTGKRGGLPLGARLSPGRAGGQTAGHPQTSDRPAQPRTGGSTQGWHLWDSRAPRSPQRRDG